jgi:hypothetical protein
MFINAYRFLGCGGKTAIGGCLAYSELEEMGIRQYRVVDPNSPMPLWFQIVDGVEKQILARQICRGEYLPSLDQK